MEEDIPVTPEQWTSVKLQPSESVFAGKLKALRDRLHEVVSDMRED